MAITDNNFIVFKLDDDQSPATLIYDINAFYDFFHEKSNRHIIYVYGYDSNTEEYVWSEVTAVDLSDSRSQEITFYCEHDDNCASVTQPSDIVFVDDEGSVQEYDDKNKSLSVCDYSDENVYALPCSSMEVEPPAPRKTYHIHTDSLKHIFIGGILVKSD